MAEVSSFGSFRGRLGRDDGGVRSIAYLELWKCASKKKYATVTVRLDGNRRIVGRPSVDSDEVSSFLERLGFAFVHVVPYSTGTSPSRLASPVYQR